MFARTLPRFAFTRAAVPAILASLAGSTVALGVFPGSINLSSLNGTTGFKLNGVDASDNSGLSVSKAGDINGDGVGDLIVGAYGGDPNGNSGAGEAYVVFGKKTSVVGPFASFINLSSLNGTTGFVLNGIDPNDFAGRSVAAAGDVNGDGIGDLLIGARAGDPNGQFAAGETYVVFGKSTAFAASLNLSSLNGATGFVLNGIDPSDESGNSVASAGDVNGDGVGDIIIGATGGDPNAKGNAGETYVVFGKKTSVVGPFPASINLSSLNGTTGFVLNGIDPSDHSGISVSGAGDVNGDGVDDVIIGASGADPNGYESGESYVVFGKKTSVVGPFAASINLSSLNGTTGFKLNGIDLYDYSGLSVSSAGDVNGDGVGDVVIGADRGDPNTLDRSGETYVVFGKKTSVVGPFAASINLSSLNGTTGFRVNGAHAYDQSGRSVSSAGDVNGDGFDDVMIGAFLADPNGQADAGEAYVVFGKTGAFPGSINLSTSLNGTVATVMNGIDTLDGAGLSVSSAGDVNGDGVDDMIIGAYKADPNAQLSAGESYVVFGIGTPAPACSGDANGDGQTTVGDFNIIATNFNSGPGKTRAQGDLTGDGFVTVADFLVLVGDIGCGVP